MTGFSRLIGMADRKRIEGEWAVFSIAVESEVLD